MAYKLGAIAGYASFGFLAARSGRKPVTMAFFAMALLLTPVLFLWTQDLYLLLPQAPINGFIILGQFSLFPVGLPGLIPKRLPQTGLAFAFHAPPFNPFTPPPPTS